MDKQTANKIISFWIFFSQKENKIQSDFLGISNDSVIIVVSAHPHCTLLWRGLESHTQSLCENIGDVITNDKGLYKPNY